MSDYLLLTASILVAIYFRHTKYRHIGFVLAAEFLVMTGYQEIILSPDSGIYFYTYQQMAPFYMYQMIIQSGFTMAYIYLNSRWLAVLSVLIMFNLSYSIVLSLYGIDAIYFEGIMLTLAILQLIAGFSGIVSANRNYINHTWSNPNMEGHKGT